jgi:lipid A ethanolaminephosphotransferase
MKRLISISPVSNHKLILLTTLFLTVTGNVAFFSHATEAYPLGSGAGGFLVSLGLLLASLLALVMALFSLVIPVRIVTSLFILLAAPIAYVSSQFGSVLDTSMIQNVLQTDANETIALLNFEFAQRILLLGVLPAIAVWLVPMQIRRPSRRVRERASIIGGALAAMLVCLLLFGAEYASFFREHKPLRYYANPIYAVYSIGKYIGERVSFPHTAALAAVLPDAILPAYDGHRELIIMVVGETARADRFSLNGYERPTNPRLAAEPRVVSYSNVSACGTSTAVSVPCIFLPQGHDDFDRDSVRESENVLDILSRAGVNVLWRDNNSGSKGVAERIAYETFNTPDNNPVCDPECRDIGLLSGLQAYIDAADRDILIVLHQMGSHGPAYFNRYPPEFEKFRPACQSANLGDCSRAEIDNAYDNSILYTDYFLSEVIRLLKSNSPAFETAMLFVSDHGESLGENGVYLHGLPYLFAPREQINVPLIIWVGPTSDIDLASAAALHNDKLTQDSIFNSLLLAFEIEDRLPDKPTAVFALSNHAD